jgi:hypothetical protein
MVSTTKNGVEKKGLLPEALFILPIALVSAQRERGTEE